MNAYSGSDRLRLLATARSYEKAGEYGQAATCYRLIQEGLIR